MSEFLSLAGVALVCAVVMGTCSFDDHSKRQASIECMKLGGVMYGTFCKKESK